MLCRNTYWAAGRGWRSGKGAHGCVAVLINPLVITCIPRHSGNSHAIHTISHDIHDISHALRELSHDIHKTIQALHEISPDINNILHAPRDVSNIIHEISHDMHVRTPYRSFHKPNHRFIRILLSTQSSGVPWHKTHLNFVMYNKIHIGEGRFYKYTYHN